MEPICKRKVAKSPAPDTSPHRSCVSKFLQRFRNHVAAITFCRLTPASPSVMQTRHHHGTERGQLPNWKSVDWLDR